jgi:hypothetical protein
MRIFIHELRGELQLYSRSRELAFFTFMLPLIFFVLLGSVYGSGDTINGYRGADYLLTGMIGYGLIATAFAVPTRCGVSFSFSLQTYSNMSVSAA